MRRVLILSVLVSATVGFAPARAQQQCPIGAYPSVDSWGTSKGRPIGTLPAMDPYGNRVCQRF